MAKTTPALWQRKLKSIDHQIIWFLVDAGAPGMLMQHGWAIDASRQLGIHRITMRRRIQVLVEAGVLVEGLKKGEVMLNLKIFNHVADRKKMRMMKATSAMVKR